MVIKEEHLALLREMGLKEDDFQLFDGKYVTYEFDEKRGVRLYDPYYLTSYNEYIDVDGWSGWSTESDTFISDVFKAARAEADRREKISQKPTHEEVAEALEKKFKKKDQ